MTGETQIFTAGCTTCVRQ